MLIKIFAASPDTFVPYPISGEPYSKDWKGQLTEAQLLWLLKEYPDCQLQPLKDYALEPIQVIGLEIALDGFYYGQDMY